MAGPTDIETYNGRDPSDLRKHLLGPLVRKGWFTRLVQKVVQDALATTRPSGSVDHLTPCSGPPIIGGGPLEGGPHPRNRRSEGVVHWSPLRGGSCWTTATTGGQNP